MLRFSSLVSSSSPASRSTREEYVYDDNESKFSKATTVVKDESLPPPILKVKRVDYYYSKWTKSYKYRVRLLIITPVFFR